MRAIFRICGNESQPGLLLVEKLATPLTTTVGGRSFQKQRERLTLSVTITNTGKKQVR